MDNDDLREEEQESLLKDMAQKGISKMVKTVPLKTKVIIAIFGVTIFLLVFIVLVSTLFYLQNGSSGGTYSGNYSYINYNSEDNYWWPIGSNETETVNDELFAIGTPVTAAITSTFGNRTLGGRPDFHYGLDIASYGGAALNIISVANGTVYLAAGGCSNEGRVNNQTNYCNSGYGNYVIIEHPGSVYTIYAHLLPGSITVSKGDTVKQGQVLGKMGNSGNSTGTHLHFQIEIGARSSKNAEDPLKYISAENPRPVTVNSGYLTGNQLLTMLQSWEGTGPTEGEYYKVYNDGTGTLTVGHGVTLKNHGARFSKRGIDASSLTVGDKVLKTIVDDIELEIVTEKRNGIISILNKHNITLEEYQIDALTIRVYNTGNINKFPSMYLEHGNTQELYENYMKFPVTSGTQYLKGLARRREAEWNLFNKGIYTLN